MINISKTLFLVSLLFLSSISVSQNVGINTTGAAPHASSMLDIVSTSSGLLIPRMTATDKGNIALPATGLLIYQTDGVAGFYYYTGAAWLPFLSSTTGWNLTGNASTTAGTNYFGTTDAVDLVFKTNGSENMRIQNGGNVGIGFSSPSEKLDVNGKTKTTTLQVTTGATNGYFLQGDATGNATWQPGNNPVGIISPYGGASAPAGWLLCDGSAVNRTTYAALFAVLGTTYGAGDGSTTFNLPDMQGRVPIGAGTGTYKSAGIAHSNGASLTVRTIGEYDGAEYPSGIPQTNNPAGTEEPAGAYFTEAESAFYATTLLFTGFMGGNGEGGNMQPYVGVNYIIKY